MATCYRFRRDRARALTRRLLFTPDATNPGPYATGARCLLMGGDRLGGILMGEGGGAERGVLAECDRSDRGGSGTVWHRELAKDVADVIRDSDPGEEEFVRDLPVGFPLHDQVEHFPFAGAERIELVVDSSP